MLNLIIWFIVTLVTELLKPDTKGPTARKYSLNEFSVPTSTEDRPLPLGYGTFQVAGNVLWYGDYEAIEVKRSVSSGWFSSTDISLGWKYHVGMWISLNAAVVDSVKEIRMGDQLVWSGDQALSKTALTTLDVDKKWNTSEGQEVPDGFQGRLLFYNHETPVGDSAVSSTYSPLDTSYLVNKIGRAVPAYPNTCHVVFLGPSAGRVGLVGKPVSYPKWGFVGSSPNIAPLLVTLKRLPVLTAALGGGARDFRYLTYPFVGTVNAGNYTRADLDAWLAARADIDGDANPAFVVLELLTTKLPGIGPRLSTYSIVLESFFRAADTLKTEGNGVSFSWESERTVGDVINDIMKQVQGQLELNERTGQLQLRLIRQSDVPVMRFDNSNLIELTSFSRIAIEEAVNEVQVPFVDRAFNWEQRIETRFNAAGARSAGAAVVRKNEYIGVSRQALAGLLASRDIRVFASPLALASWTGTVEPGTVLKPGQLVELVHQPTGQLLRMRIKTARFANWDSRLRVEIEAVEDVFRNGTVGASTPPVTTLPPASTPPQALTGASLEAAPYALHGDDYDHLMYVGLDPGVSTTGFRAAVQEGITAWSDFDTSTYAADVREPSIVGFLAATMAASSISPAVQMSLSDAAVEQWKKVTRGLVYMQIDNEWLACSAWSLTGNTLTASTAERGIFDTVPGRHAAGSTVKLLLGYGIYGPRAKTYVTSGVELAGLTSAVARAESYGPGGLLEPVDAAVSQATWSYAAVPANARAPKPLPPAYLRIGSIAGALSLTDTVPSLTRASSVTLNWYNRNRLTRATAGYYTSTNDNEPTVTLSYSLDWETSPGVFTNSGNYTTLSTGVTTANVTLASVPTGARMIRLRVIMNRPISVPSGINFCQSNPVDVYWHLTS